MRVTYDAPAGPTEIACRRPELARKMKGSNFRLTVGLDRTLGEAHIDALTDIQIGAISSSAICVTLSIATEGVGGAVCAAVVALVNAGVAYVKSRFERAFRKSKYHGTILRVDAYKTPLAPDVVPKQPKINPWYKKKRRKRKS